MIAFRVPFLLMLLAALVLNVATISAKLPANCRVQRFRTYTMVTSHGTWGDFPYRVEAHIPTCIQTEQYPTVTATLQNETIDVTLANPNSRQHVLEGTLDVSGKPYLGKVNYRLSENQKDGLLEFSSNIQWRGVETSVMALCRDSDVGVRHQCYIEDLMPALITFFFVIPLVLCLGFLYRAYQRREQYLIAKRRGIPFSLGKKKNKKATSAKKKTATTSTPTASVDSADVVAEGAEPGEATAAVGGSTMLAASRVDPKLTGLTGCELVMIEGVPAHVELHKQTDPSQRAVVQIVSAKGGPLGAEKTLYLWHREGAMKTKLMECISLTVATKQFRTTLGKMQRLGYVSVTNIDLTVFDRFSKLGGGAKATAPSPAAAPAPAAQPSSSSTVEPPAEKGQEEEVEMEVVPATGTSSVPPATSSTASPSQEKTAQKEEEEEELVPSQKMLHSTPDKKELSAAEASKVDESAQRALEASEKRKAKDAEEKCAKEEAAEKKREEKKRQQEEEEAEQQKALEEAEHRAQLRDQEAKEQRKRQQALEEEKKRQRVLLAEQEEEHEEQRDAVDDDAHTGCRAIEKEEKSARDKISKAVKTDRKQSLKHQSEREANEAAAAEEVQRQRQEEEEAEKAAELQREREEEEEEARRRAAEEEEEERQQQAAFESERCEVEDEETEQRDSLDQEEATASSSFANISRQGVDAANKATSARLKQEKKDAEALEAEFIAEQAQERETFGDSTMSSRRETEKEEKDSRDKLRKKEKDGKKKSQQRQSTRESREADEAAAAAEAEAARIEEEERVARQEEEKRAEAVLMAAEAEKAAREAEEAAERAKGEQEAARRALEAEEEEQARVANQKAAAAEAEEEAEEEARRRQLEEESHTTPVRTPPADAHVCLGLSLAELKGEKSALVIDTLDDQGPAHAAGIRLNDFLIGLGGEEVGDGGMPRARALVKAHCRVAETCCFVVKRNDEIISFDLVPKTDDARFTSARFYFDAKSAEKLYSPEYSSPTKRKKSNLMKGAASSAKK